MPTDASGTIIASQICETQNLYTGSALTTSTTYCYNSRDVSINFGIEFLAIAGTVMTIAIVYRFLKKDKPQVILNSSFGNSNPRAK